LAVPTGRVFVRFRESVVAADRIAAIRSAGFSVTELVPYAPQAAWLLPMSQRVVDALIGLEALARLTDVENVEPQMLMERHYRGARRRG
jgi:hypothetical protein